MKTYITKRFIFLLSLVFLFYFSLASADIIPVGYRGVSYCFQISNIEDYKDYTFIAYFQEPMGGHEIIDQDECVGFYKFSNPKIYAIKSSDFNHSDIGTGYENEKIYFNTNQNLVSSDLKIESLSTVPLTDPRSGIVDVLEIKDITEDSLALMKSKVIYTYTDGRVEEKIYTEQDLIDYDFHDTDGVVVEENGGEGDFVEQNQAVQEPESSMLPWWFEKLWYIAIPLGAVIIFILILLMRRLKR